MLPGFDKVSLKCNLKEILERNELSVLKLSEELNENREMLTRLVHNKNMRIRRIPVKLAAKLCKYFNITLDQLFTIVEVQKEIKKKKVCLNISCANYNVTAHHKQIRCKCCGSFLNEQVITISA